MLQKVVICICLFIQYLDYIKKTIVALFKIHSKKFLRFPSKTNMNLACKPCLDMHIIYITNVFLTQTPNGTQYNHNSCINIPAFLFRPWN